MAFGSLRHFFLSKRFRREIKRDERYAEKGEGRKVAGIVVEDNREAVAKRHFGDIKRNFVSRAHSRDRETKTKDSVNLSRLSQRFFRAFVSLAF